MLEIRKNAWTLAPNGTGLTVPPGGNGTMISDKDNRPLDDYVNVSLFFSCRPDTNTPAAGSFGHPVWGVRADFEGSGFCEFSFDAQPGARITLNTRNLVVIPAIRGGVVGGTRWNFAFYAAYSRSSCPPSPLTFTNDLRLTVPAVSTSSFQDIPNMARALTIHSSTGLNSQVAARFQAEDNSSDVAIESMTTRRIVIPGNAKRYAILNSSGAAVIVSTQFELSV